MLTFLSFTTLQKGEWRRAFLSEEASSGIYRLRTERGMSLSKPEEAENSFWHQVFFQTKSACRGGTSNGSGQKVASCESRRARETRKPDGGKTPDRKTQVGNLRLFRKPWGIHPSFRFFFSFPFFLLLCGCCLGLGGAGGNCFTFVTQAGLELEALLKPLLLGHRLVTRSALKKKFPLPHRRGGLG